MLMRDVSDDKRIQMKRIYHTSSVRSQIVSKQRKQKMYEMTSKFYIDCHISVSNC